MRRFVLFLLSLFILFTVSCEIGLGSAVDTQPPNVSITYPPSLSIIRDTFTLSGTWSDDKSLEGVYVEVYQSKNDNHIRVFQDKATITLEGTWSIDLNKYDEKETDWYNGWQFCDGDYEIQVYAKDNSEHFSGIASRTFSIDNTPPILIITNPTSAGNDASPATFGQIVQLTGAFYDFCGKISTLVVSFYDSEGNAICDSEFSNITSMSDSSPLTIARYYSTEKERTANKTVFDNYVALFGADQLAKFEEGGVIENQQIYFTITAKDGAKAYKNEKDEPNGSGSGNATKHFYRGTTSMQNLVSGDGGIEDFSLADFGQFLNKTSDKYISYSTKINDIADSARGVSVTNQTTQTIADYINNNNSKDGDPVYLTFVLNPKNNPSYTIGGYEIIDTPVNDNDNYSENGYKKTYQGTPIPISISVGADNKNISTHTVSIYRIDRTNLRKDNYTGEISQNFFTQENNDLYYTLMWTWNSEVLEKYAEWGLDKSDIYTPTNSDANVSSLSKQFIIEEFDVEHDYEFFVVGKDITGNDIISTRTKGYGFCGVISETAPHFEIKEGFAQNSIIKKSKVTGEGAVTKDDILHLSGVIKSDRELFGEDGFNYSLTIIDSTDNTRTKTITKNIPIAIYEQEEIPDYTRDFKSIYCYTTNTDTSFVYNWRFTTEDFVKDSTVAAMISEPGSYELTLELTAKNSETSISSIDRTFTLDTNPPAPELVSISVAVDDNSEAGGYWVNPKKALKISGLVTDNLSSAKACKTWIKFVALSAAGVEVTAAPGNNSGSKSNYTTGTVTNVNKWTFDIPAETIAATYFGANMYIYSEDVAGNINDAQAIPLYFDTEAPKGIHIIDTKLKDLYFRVGEQDRDDFVKIENGKTVTTIESLPFNENLDKDVGGKYSDGTFGNASTITIRGNFEDTGSGVQMIYYKVFQGEDNDPTDTSGANLEALKKDVMENPTGKFAPLTTIDTKRVFYNDSETEGQLNGQIQAEEVHTATDGGKTKYWTLVESNYLTTLSGFNPGVNYLVLVAEDNVGNAQVDAQAVDGTFYNNFKLNVDNTPPNIETGAKFSKSQFHRPANGDFVVYGKATDDAAGIRSLVIKVNGKEISKDDETYGKIKLVSSGNIAASGETDSVILSEYNNITFSDTLVWWKAEIHNTVFDGVENGKSISVQAIVTDNAGTGNSETYPIASITVDNSEPEVTIKTPVNGATVNKTITLSVVTNDGNGAGFEDNYKPILYYTEKNANTENGTAPGLAASDFTNNKTTGWKKIEVDNQKVKLNSENGGWNFEINTQEVFVDETPIWVTISSTDKVGNVGYATAHKLKVSQDSDRPEVKLTNFVIKDESSNTNPDLQEYMSSEKPVWFNRSELYGTVTDDDGSVKSVKIIAKNIADSEPTTAEWTSAENLFKNGSWTYNFPENGAKKIYFRIEDADETVFVSNVDSVTPATYGPKIVDAKENIAGNATLSDDIIYTKVDTDDPSLDYFNYYTSDSVIAQADLNNITWRTTTSSIIDEKFGGTKYYLYIKYKATDTNGINSINVDFGGEEAVNIIPVLDNAQSKEAIAYFDISSVSSGITKLTINIKDNAAANTNSAGISKYYEMKVDNDAPEIAFSNHKSGEQVYGSSAVNLRGTTSDSNTVTKVEYALTKTGSYVPLNGWTIITQEQDKPNKPSYTGALGWQIVYDGQGNEADTSSYHAELLKKSVFDLQGITGEQAQAAYDTTTKVYVWIRATDELGNVSTNGVKEDGSDLFYFDVIPNGDRPSISITYPEKDDSVGGTIRITGTTTIQDTAAKVDDVYIQIDPDYNGTAFNENWYSNDVGLGKLMADKNVRSYEIETLSNIVQNGITKKLGDEIGYGIKAKGSTTSWYLPINSNLELNDKVNGENRKVAIRAYAVGSKGKISCSEIYTFTIDPDAPLFGDTNELRFVQYSDNALSVESASRKYESGIYLKGQWYLVGSVEDASGILSMILQTEINGEVTSENLVSNGAIENTVSAQAKVFENSSILSDTINKNYDIKIPIGSTEENDFGVLKYKISVQDGSQSGTPNELSFSIAFDNKLPEFEVVNGNGKPLSDADNRVIYQSNGSYNISGTFKEESVGTRNQSGFARIAMYFTRIRKYITGEGANQQTVYKLCLLDPLADDGANGDENFVVLGTYSNNPFSASEATLNRASDIVEKEGLYWRTADATVANTNELTVSGAMPSNVRAGGLCMVENVIYRIKSISGNVVILEGALSDISNATEVYFALAQVIDNLSQESGTTVVAAGTTGNDGITNGDGDYMVEGVRFSGGVYSWNADLDSSNMLDGNIDTCFVAFDAAGNSVTRTISQKISNNAPRIAGVSFGADKNLDGQVTDGSNNTLNEMITRYQYAFKDITFISEGKKYNGRKSDGEWVTSYKPFPIDIEDSDGNMTTADNLVVKGAIKVKPEIVGGNGGLGWQYAYKKRTGNGTTETNVQRYTKIVNGESVPVGHSNDGSIRTDDLSINISLLEFVKNQIKEGSQDNNLVFTIWDETDGSTLGEAATGSAKAEIIIPVNVMINDGKAPTTQIEPFYWNNKDENSLYKNSQKNGHIELETDWRNASGYDSSADSGEYDADPKASGKITFEVTAKDNVIVNQITAKISDYKPSATASKGTEFVIAKREADRTNAESNWTAHNGWISLHNANAGAELDANNDWTFELVSDEYDSTTDENTVKFKFHFNTETIEGVAVKDVDFTFIASDKGSPSVVNDEVVYNSPAESNPAKDSDGNTVTPSTDTGFYQVDIVPYIANIYTYLSSLKKKDWSVYGRTALGHYSVASDETIYLYGFNLGNNYKNSQDEYPYRPHYGLIELAAPVNGSVSNIGTENAPKTPPYPYGNDYATYMVLTFPVSNVTSSGEIKITVNGVSSLNNSNNSEAKGSYTGTVTNSTGDYDIYEQYFYNRQPNDDNNNLLTDDVVLDVWEIDPQAVRPKIGGITQPVMNINPVNGQIGFAFVNGTLYYSMPYGTQKNVNDTESTEDKVYSYYYWIGGIDAWTSVEFAYDEYGHSFGATAGGDINERKADQFRIMTSRWGTATLTNEGYRGGKNQLRLEMIGQQEYTGSGTDYTVYPSFNKERVQSPSLATTASDVDNTTVYLAYYDDCNDEIRFKWGGINDTTRTATGGFLADIYGDDYNSEGSSLSGGKYIDGYNNKTYGVYRLNYNSLIAGQTKDHVISKTGTKVSAQVKTTDNQPVYAGKYVSIAALKGKGNDYIPAGTTTSIKDDAVVAVWWDGTNNQLVYSYNMNPHGIEPGEYLQADTGWSKPVPIFSSGIGEYCKIKADSKNGIHIVGYDGTNSDVWYAYVSDFKNPAGYQACLVDSYGIIGTELNIDVALKNGKAVPYISYYAASCVRPKTAYLACSIDNLSAGVIDDVFTGQWEVSIVPTSSRVSEDHINIGVWKNKDTGELSNSIHYGNTYKQGADIAATQESYGTIWGNDTKNPVIGYATTKGSGGFIETAQMR